MTPERFSVIREKRQVLTHELVMVLRPIALELPDEIMPGDLVFPWQKEEYRYCFKREMPKSMKSWVKIYQSLKIEQKKQIGQCLRRAGIELPTLGELRQIIAGQEFDQVKIRWLGKERKRFLKELFYPKDTPLSLTS